MAEISRRAGVGMATLYRNFAGRRELLEALYVDEVDAVVSAAQTVKAKSPGTSLVAWARTFFAFFISKRNVGAELLKTAAGTDPLFKNSRARVLAAGRPLLLAAQRSGEVDNSLTLEQILDMVIAISTIDGGSAYVQPILESALNGLVAPEA
jgi:AcrR family transcriptional regulator